MRNSANNYLVFPALLFAALLLSGCSNSMQTAHDDGERMSERGSEISARGEAWTDGQRQLAQGRKLVAHSTDELADYEKKLMHANKDVLNSQQKIEVAKAERVNGEQLIADGTLKMQQAEAAYTQIKNGPSAIAP